MNDLYFVHDNPEEIDFSLYPHRFALKTTHGCSTNLIVSNKDTVNNEESIIQIREWLSEYPGEASGELHYKKIKPRIIVEKYLDDGTGSLPLDYKIFCFNGEPKYIRITDEKNLETGYSKQVYFDFEWNFKDFSKQEFTADSTKFEKPTNLGEMYSVAKILSSDFPFVRVDLYNIKESIVFGELTFTPTGGFNKMFKDETNNYFGSLLELPSPKREY